MSKLSLRGIDIVVSFREATAERRDNLYTVLRHLDYTYRDYRVWLMEADARPRFDWARLSDPKIRHVFLREAGQFPKSLLYNTGARLCTSEVICFHDADCISRPQFLTHCVDRLLDGDGSDEPGEGVGAMCPFQSMINVGGATRQAFQRTPDWDALPEVRSLEALPDDTTLLYRYNVGGVFLFRRQAYVRVGGCNPALTGWGSEDNELFARARRLGYDWQVVPEPMFHMHHDNATRDGYSQSGTGARNLQVELETDRMPLEALQALSQRLSSFFA